MSTFVSFGNSSNKFERMSKNIILAIKLLPKPIRIQAGVNICFFDNLDKEIFVFDYCDANDFQCFVNESKVFITHAGVGSVYSALKLKKMPLVFPRQYDLNEHIDNHQLEFCKKMVDLKLISLAKDESSIANFILDGVFNLSNLTDIDILTNKRLIVDLNSYIKTIL